MLRTHTTRTLTNNGARHKITGPLLGLVRDFEADGLPSANASGDDMNQTPDDEDGLVEIIPLRRGTTEELSIRVTGFGRLHAWVDFNLDGDFLDPEEKVIDNTQVSDGVNILPVSVPPTVSVNTSTAVRFRLVSASGLLGPHGPAPNGEVEDYSLALAVASFDFGDAPDSYGTLLASDGARHRAATPVLGAALPDVGSDAVSPLDGTGDDNNAALDDEYGVTIPTMQVNVGASVPYQVAGIGTHAAGRAVVQGWFDWNRNGLFDHPAEMAINVIRIRNGTFTTTVTPPTGSGGNTFARFRISTEGGLGPKGFAATGEVEDYSIFIIGEDFADAPDSYLTTLTNDGARHIATGPFLGTNRDSDADGLPSIHANGDDLNQTPDDEDGVIIGGLTIGTTNTVRVFASAAGLLTAFVDLNRSKNFGPGEKLLDRVAVSPGENRLVINIPASALAGSAFARFRLTSSHDSLSAAGLVSDGEVEDYEISLLGDFGDAPDSYHTTQTNSGPWHAPIGPQLGANRDAEAAALAPLDGTGDDADESPEDEDGLVSLTGLARNAVGQLVVNTPTGGKLDAWIDFDVNGQFDDPVERITAPGGAELGLGDTTLTFTCPSSTVSGQSPIATFARLRISSMGGLPPTALAPDGEVEDHMATILPGLPWLSVTQTDMRGEFRLLLQGEAQRTYRIQFTSSLPGGWQTLADIVSTNSNYIYTDTQAGSAPQRFYRVEVRP